MKLFKELKNEHIIILEFLTYFEEMIKTLTSDSKQFCKKDFELSFRFIQNFVDKLHHGKEEIALFPLAYEAQLLRGGGRTVWTHGTVVSIRNPLQNKL